MANQNQLAKLSNKKQKRGKRYNAKKHKKNVAAVPHRTPKKPKNTKQSILSHLNRDCLLYIFTFLNVYDLPAVANVSKEFRDMADVEFERRFHGDFDFSSLLIEYSNKFISPIFMYGRAKGIVYRFGHSIKKITLSPYWFMDRDSTNELLLDIGEECTTLTELCLHEVFFPINQMEKLQPMFLSIEKFELVASHFPYIGNLNVPKLKILSFRELDNGYFLLTDLPKLEELYFDVYEIDSNSADSIVLKGPQLRVLSVQTYIRRAYKRIHLDIIRSLGDRIEHIELLDKLPSSKQQKIQEALEILSTRKSLKIAKLNCSGFSISNFLNNIANENDVINIEHLHLWNGILSYESASFFAKMDKLSTLVLDKMKPADGTILLSEMLKETLPPCLKELSIRSEKEISQFNDIGHLKVLLNRLVNLTHFRIVSRHLNISLATYNTFIEILKRRPQTATTTINLKIVIYGNGGQINVPHELREANKHWLDIEESIQNNPQPFYFDNGNDHDDSESEISDVSTEASASEFETSDTDTEEYAEYDDDTSQNEFSSSDDYY